MTDTTIAETDKQANTDFASGFDLETPPPQQTTTEPVIAPKIEVKPEPKPEPKPAPKAPVAKFVQITQEQFDSLQAAAGKTTAIEGQLSKAFGTIGDMQQIVRKLQSATPAGQPVEMPKTAFAKLRKDFPELADLMADDMADLLKGMRGTATPETAAATAPDPEALSKLVSATTIKLEVEALEDAHPKWREIVGAVDSEGRHDPNNAYRKWLATQDATYQAKINSTNSSTVIARSIDKFMASKKAAPVRVAPKTNPKAAARLNRIRGAVQPRGDGGQPAPAKTADDDFREGFRTG